MYTHAHTYIHTQICIHIYIYIHIKKYIYLLQCSSIRNALLKKKKDTIGKIFLNFHKKNVHLPVIAFKYI